MLASLGFKLSLSEVSTSYFFSNFQYTVIKGNASNANGVSVASDTSNASDASDSTDCGHPIGHQSMGPCVVPNRSGDELALADTF